MPRNTKRLPPSGFAMSVDYGELREIAGGVIGQAHHQQRAVIVRSESAAAVFIGGVENNVANFTGGLQRRDFFDGSSQPLEAELLLFRVFGFENAIGCEQNGVSRAKLDGDLIVFRIRKKAERDAADSDLLHFAIAD